MSDTERKAFEAWWERTYGTEPMIVAWKAWQARAALAVPVGAGDGDGVETGEALRPDILERLSYHQLERDDLTLDDCLSYLARGWREVHGRTERQMVMQILELLASRPAGVMGEVPRG